MEKKEPVFHVFTMASFYNLWPLQNSDGEKGFVLFL
jgi:hypothetical protein